VRPQRAVSLASIQGILVKFVLDKVPRLFRAASQQEPFSTRGCSSIQDFAAGWAAETRKVTLMSLLDKPTTNARLPIATLAPAAAHIADHRRIVFGAGMRRATAPVKPPVHLRDNGKVKFGGGI